MKMISVTQTVLRPVCSTIAMTSRRIYIKVNKKINICIKETYIAQSGFECLSDVIVDSRRDALDTSTAG